MYMVFTVLTKLTCSEKRLLPPHNAQRGEGNSVELTELM